VVAAPDPLMRVVLDTNTLLSALLFRGTASRLVPVWQSGRITPLVSRPILDEYLRVLAYPKFQLSAEEAWALIVEEVLPFAETVKPAGRLSVPCRDLEDRKFLECALSGRARYLVTGDQDLLEMNPHRGITILTVGAFLEILARRQ
jgi:putative PIN family toxin of toxin-antitoxin system